MSITINSGFEINGTTPVDARLCMDKATMKTIPVSDMPDMYFTASEDNLYVYNKSNDDDPDTGRFREIQGAAALESIVFDAYESSFPVMPLNRAELLECMDNIKSASSTGEVPEGSVIRAICSSEVYAFEWDTNTDEPAFYVHDSYKTPLFKYTDSNIDVWTSIIIQTDVNSTLPKTPDEADALFKTFYKSNVPNVDVEPYHKNTEASDLLGRPVYDKVVTILGELPSGINSYDDLIRLACPGHSYEPNSTSPRPCSLEGGPLTDDEKTILADAGLMVTGTWKIGFDCGN